MCLIIHKPAGSVLPRQLIESACAFNPHGAGFIALPEEGDTRLGRVERSHAPVVIGWAKAHAGAECVFHFRYRTRGNLELENVHPVQVTEDIHLFHNGTLPLALHTAGRSDTWHLCRDFLEPVLSHRPELLAEPMFRTMVEAGLGKGNRGVLVDRRRRRVLILNREQGFERAGLWLSNLRWFDARTFGWHTVPPAIAVQHSLSFAS